MVLEKDIIFKLFAMSGKSIIELVFSPIEYFCRKKPLLKSSSEDGRVVFIVSCGCDLLTAGCADYPPLGKR